MKFVSVRDLRSRSSEVWRELDRERELIITSNGRPIAIVSATDEASFEQSLQDVRQTRALRAARQLQAQSLADDRDKLSAKDIDAEIAAVRKGRRR